MTDAARALSELGFTGLEAEIYAYLLKHSPATGYRIAQGIGKPIANTYKAIATLHEKGGIEVEEGDTRLCRAVPSQELISRLERSFESRKNRARELLASIVAAEEDDRLYQLKSRGQAIERVREMLARAETIALLRAGNSVLEELRADLDKVKEGLRVVVATDEEIALERAETFVGTEDEFLLAAVIDGSEALFGRLHGHEFTGVWTRNDAIAEVQHAGLAAQINVLSTLERLDDGAGPKRLAKALETVPEAVGAI